tara:strand:+ start:6095 stop:7255 length:1161 start_codon:yes stop_codon:yes gene_type:complete
MARWEPSLYLKLDGNKVIVEGPATEDEYRIYGPLEYDGVLSSQASDLVGWLSIAAGTKRKGRSRVRSESEVARLGLDVFQLIFDIPNGSNTNTLSDVLKKVLADTSLENPPSIVFEGPWYALPWEALVVPIEVTGRSAPAFLGELAVIASFKAREFLPKEALFEVDDDLQIVSMEGQSALKHCRKEVEQVCDFSGANIAPVRVLRGLRRARGGTTDAQNCAAFHKIMNADCPVEFLHGAFHSNCPDQAEPFAIDLDQDYTLTSSIIRQQRAKVENTNVAFFNTCQGLSGAKWHSGGIAGYASTYWRSQTVVASYCEIDDDAACDFSSAFLSRILPTDDLIGEEFGRALYDTRREMLLRSGPQRLVALTYRLIGSPNTQISVVQDAA